MPMPAGLNFLANMFQADLARLRARTVTAAACYAVAALLFAGAIGLGGAAGTIALVERFGLVEGLAFAALVLALIGVIALLVNTMSRLRHERRAHRAAAMRSAALSQLADEGLQRTREKVPAMLPAAAILTFTLTSMFLGKSRS
jgi:hypothetical protein